MVTWTDIYRAERDGLVRLAYLMTGSQAVAEDLVQDTFIRVMARLAPDGSPGAYLRRSVINACYSWHRRAWREVQPGDDERLAAGTGRFGAATGGGGSRGGISGGSLGRRGSGEGGRTATGGGASVRRAAGGGGDHADREQGDIEMWDALDRLAPRRRTVLVMRYYLDMTEADVADTLGCRVGTVKSTTHRALAELRKMIEP